MRFFKGLIDTVSLPGFQADCWCQPSVLREFPANVDTVTINQVSLVIVCRITEMVYMAVYVTLLR